MKTVKIAHRGERVGYIDAIRGFAILVVVLGHILNIGTGNYDENELLHRIIYAFHMPLFFFISGIVSYKKTEVWTGMYFMKFVKRKSLVLIVPTFVFFVLAMAIEHKNISEAFIEGGVGRYWFGQALFQMLLVYGLISWISNRISTYLLMPLLIICCLSRAICLFVDEEPLLYRVFVSREFFMNFYFFVFGLMARKYHGTFTKMIESSNIRGWALVIFMGFLVLVYQEWMPSFAIKLSNQLFLRISGVLLIYCLFYHSQKYLEQKNFISNSLKFIGKRTFDIYLIHYFFIPDLSGIWRYIGESDMLLFQLMVSMFLMITTVFCSILLGEIVRRSGRVAKWILGVY